MKNALIAILCGLLLTGCINLGGTPDPTPSYTPTPTEEATTTPEPTQIPTVTPTAAPTVTPTTISTTTPSPTTTASPKCIMTALPEIGIGPLESVISASFENIPSDVVTATLKCSASANESTTDITTTGRAFKTCYYQQVSDQTAATASASAGGASCSVLITINPKPGPEVSNITYSLLNYSAVRITWNTNVESNGSIEYGTSTSFGSSKNETTTGTSHQVVLTDLSAGTPYYFRVVSCAGGCTYSASVSFTTSAGDSTAPTVTLNTPADNTWQTSVSQTLSYTPFDANGISNCSLYLNTSGTLALDTTTYSVTNNTANSFAKTLTESAFLWNVNCSDRSGNTATGVTRTLKIDATPPSQVTGLIAPLALQTTIDLNWTASTDSFSGVSRYIIYRDTVNINNVTSPTVTYHDEGLTPATEYKYYVKAVDTAGNYGTASTEIPVVTSP
ncbi:MAG: fibronectin type III domain-containing protein [Candidatus Micrarchaeota archaeon]